MACREVIRHENRKRARFPVLYLTWDDPTQFSPSVQSTAPISTGTTFATTASAPANSTVVSSGRWCQIEEFPKELSSATACRRSLTFVVHIDLLLFSCVHQSRSMTVSHLFVGCSPAAGRRETLKFADGRLHVASRSVIRRHSGCAVHSRVIRSCRAHSITRFN